jgi:hypothetical protein
MQDLDHAEQIHLVAILKLIPVPFLQKTEDVLI